MPNQTVNKVQFGNQTVMDITDTTADAADVIQGEVFYTKSGVRSTGTLGDATQSTHGLMSAADKIKLDGIDGAMYQTIDTPAAGIILTGAADDTPIVLQVAIGISQSGSGDPSPTNVRSFTGFTECNITVANGTIPTEPDYQAHQYEIKFPVDAGTVYSGKLTIDNSGSGVLVVDRGLTTYDGSSDENWVYTGTTTAGYYIENANVKKSTSDYTSIILSDKLKTTAYAYDSSWSSASACISGYRDANNTYPNNNWLYVKDTATVAGSAATFKSWLSSNPIQVCYELPTPITYNFTATQIKTLLGTNYVWADTGNINSCTYLSSTNNTITTAERYKLSTVEEGAQVNPGNATQSAAGLMSAADKTKLDSITGNVYTDYTITIAVADWTASNGSYVYTWTNAAVTTQCLADVIFITDPDTVLAGLSLSADKVTGGMQFVCDGTPSGALTVKIRIIDSDTTAALQNATTTQDGIMSAQDKVKLDAVYQASAYHESDMGIVETTNTATHAISAGQYVIWKGQLYTADSAITVGATLAASGGSKNLTAVSNGGLNALNDNITNKLTGENDASNKNIILRNNNYVATFETVAQTPSEINPSVFIDINPATKAINFYKDVGSGYVLFSTLPLP